MSGQPDVQSPLVDRRLEVETPEQVAVGFELAGPGSRFTAFLLDALLIIGILLGLALGGALVTRISGASIGPLVGAVLVLVTFALVYGYFIWFEGFRDGQTPGKKVFALRVVQDGGYPITLKGAAIRNLLRLIDTQPFPSWLLGGLFILFHSKAQRIGDLAAGTVVVRERPVRLLLDEAAPAEGPPRMKDDEYALLSEYALRRDTLDTRARERVAAKLAAHFRVHAEGDGRADGARRRDENDDTLLRGLYAGESARRSAVGARAGTGSPAAAGLVRRQRARWTDYRKLLGEARRSGLAALPEHDVSRFAALYREVAADLARARTYGGSPALLYTLERSVGAGHNLLYAPPRRSALRAWHWFKEGFPRLVRRRARVVAVAALLLFGPAVISAVAVAFEPGIARQMMPPEMITRAEQGAARMDRGLGYIEVPPIAMPLMATGIIANNVQVSFVAFAGGVLAGLGTVFILLLNGVFLGAVVGLFHAEGLNLYLWAFVAPHGVIELTAIVIAGAAGLWLGSALILPGRMTRGRALVERGREAISLIAGVVLLLLLAGVIEGFISPGPFPPEAKIGFGVLTGMLLFPYLALAGRGGEDAPTTAFSPRL